MKSVGRSMKKMRLGLNVSKRLVGEAANLTESIVDKVECGGNYPDRTIERIWLVLYKFQSGEAHLKVVQLMPIIQSKAPLGAIKRLERYDRSYNNS